MIDRAVAARVLGRLSQAGVRYGDVRVMHTLREQLESDTGVVVQSGHSMTEGLGIRVLHQGGWGFAAVNQFDDEAIDRAVHEALTLAKAAGTLRPSEPAWTAEKPVTDRWQTPVLEDPFRVSLADKLLLLTDLDRRLRGDARIKRASASLVCERVSKHFVNTEGSDILQTLTFTGAGLTCVASDGKDAQLRSFPANLGGNFVSGGWEFIRALNLPMAAERVRNEAIELLSAPSCPSGEMDVVLTPSQLVLQIHESVGHATELDRVMGWEAEYAGTSFVSTDKLGQFQYGSPLVNLVADSTLPGGLATFGYDDDGVKAQRWPVVQNGQFVNYLTSRETASEVGQSTSLGCNRADSHASTPITRIANLSLMPGDSTMDELIGGIDQGVLMDMNKSWSIDQRRLNFEFACEAAWEIKNGKLGRLLRNPVYHGMTPQFWNACDAIADERWFELVGVMNCGKGQPVQINRMTHASSPARFRKLAVC